MKKTICLLLLGLMSFGSLSYGDELAELESELSGGEEEFQFERLSDDAVMLQIQRDAKIACNKAGLCTLTSVTSRDTNFEISVNLGVGNNPYAYGGASGGTYINLNDQQLSQQDREYYGVNIAYNKGKCTQSIQVPRSLYIAVNKYMYSLLNEDTSIRPGLNHFAKTSFFRIH